MSKKLIIAISALALAIIAGVVAVVGVFAAQQQKVANTFTISYTANNVKAQVMGYLWTKNQSFGQGPQLNRELESGDIVSSADFTPDMSQETQYLELPAAATPITASDEAYMLCFFITNQNSTGGKSLTATLTDSSVTKNVAVYYRVSLDQDMGPIKYKYADMVDDAYKTIPSATTVAPGQTAYIFMCIKIVDLTLDAEYTSSAETGLHITLDAVA